MREPIVKLGEKILDGRRRERACAYAGVKPNYREFGSKKSDGDDPLEFVIDINLHRRHMGDGERILAAARYATAKAGRISKNTKTAQPEPFNDIADHAPAATDAPRTNQEAAEKFETSPATVKRAKVVIEGGTKKLIKAVKDEKVSVSDAATIAKLPPKAQNRAVNAVLANKAKTVAEVAFPLCERCKQVGKQDGCTGCAYLAECIVEGKKPKPIASDEPVKDDAGTVVPMRLIPVFLARKDFDAALKLLNATAKACQTIEKGPCKDAKPLEGVYRKYSSTFKEARKMLVGGRPSIVCPDCGGDGPTGCRCMFSPIGGFLTKERIDAK